MIYKVHEGCTVCWPDGSLRAKEGEVFDGFDTNGTKLSIEFASAILASSRDHIYPVDEPISATADVSLPCKLAFADLGGSMEAVATAAPAKKKSSKKKVARKHGSVADPDDAHVD